MRVVDHRQFQKPLRPKRRVKRYVLWPGVILAGLFILGNGVMWGIYRNRVLPNFYLGATPVGGMSMAELPTRLQASVLLSKTITLQKAGQSVPYAATALGVRCDTVASVAALKAARPPLPLLTLFTHHTVPLNIAIDTMQFATGSERVSAAFVKGPQPTHIAFEGQTFVAKPPMNGQKVDVLELKKVLVSTLREGKAVVTVPTTTVKAPVANDVSGELQKLQKQLGLQLSFVHAGKSRSPNSHEIGSWYVASGQTMQPSGERIGAYLDGITPAAANRSDLILAVQYALAKDQALNFVLVSKGSITHTYCTAARGASTVALDDMIGKLASTYADIRGWNDGGRIAFQHVAGGCEYTVWLSDASAMTSFAAICDSYYSCQAGTNVVINEDRWNQATGPWNAAGGNLEDYRTLVINHETGHRLGFYDDPVCPAAGGPAPVMMQQSMDLHGCVFSRWPDKAELATLLTRNGLDTLNGYSGI